MIRLSVSASQASTKLLVSEIFQLNQLVILQCALYCSTAVKCTADCSVVAFESSRGGSEELDVSTFSVVAFTASDVNTTQLSPAQPALQTRGPNRDKYWSE